MSYDLVASSLREQIQDGRLSPGEQVPTEAVLAEQFAVSRQTVRRAFQDLVTDGLVERTRGRGTFVRTKGPGYIRQVGSIDDLMAISSDTELEIVDPLRPRLDRPTADRLRLPSDEVAEVTFLRRHAGTAFCLTKVALPPEIVDRLGDVDLLRTPGARGDWTIIGLLDKSVPGGISDAHQSISVGELTPSAAMALSVQTAQPTLLIDRLYLDSSGRPVELAVSHFLPGLYSYRIQLHRSQV